MPGIPMAEQQGREKKTMAAVSGRADQRHGMVA